MQIEIGDKVQLSQITRKIGLNKEIISRLLRVENDTECNKE